MPPMERTPCPHNITTEPARYVVKPTLRYPPRRELAGQAMEVLNARAVVEGETLVCCLAREVHEQEEMASTQRCTLKVITSHHAVVLPLPCGFAHCVTHERPASHSCALLPLLGRHGTRSLLTSAHCAVSRRAR